MNETLDCRYDDQRGVAGYRGTVRSLLEDQKGCEERPTFKHREIEKSS